MSIKSEITRLKDAKSVLRYWLMTKNVTVPGYATLSELTDLLSKVPVVDTEVVKVTVSNHTKASVTAYGLDGPVEIPSQTDGTVSTLLGAMIHIEVTTQTNYFYSPTDGEVIDSSENGAHVKITDRYCTVYVTISPIV